MDGMTDELLDTRRRRALYRACHRGTKEMDWLLGRYGAARLSAMPEADLTEFEAFLSLPDPDLHQWIIEPRSNPGSRFDGLIASIRAFHNLTEPAGR